MGNKKRGSILILMLNFQFLMIMFAACNENKVLFDASGSFEATETIISSEATGIIKDLSIEEGQTIKIRTNCWPYRQRSVVFKEKTIRIANYRFIGKKTQYSNSVIGP